MTGDRENTGITLASGVTGGQVLLALLQQAQAQFPETFQGISLPADARELKGRYSELLPAFEAARVQSAQASEIARAIVLHASQLLRYVEPRAGEQTEPATTLSDALRAAAEPLPLVRVDLPGRGVLRAPTVGYGGRLYSGPELAVLAAELAQTSFATSAAVRALTEVGELAGRTQGLSLRGQRVVLFGAGAELSPVYTLLEAGADVLWLDRDKPPIDRLLEPRLGGSLSYVDRGVDLLTQPAAIRATIVEFAGGQPLQLGLYAFATGAACPLRLALGTNELVRSLPRELVGSLSFLLSPTSVNFVYPEDAARADERAVGVSTMRRALVRAGQLSPGRLEAGALGVSRAVVAQQGAAYQVAEYVGKRLAAEAFCEFGSTLTSEPLDARATFFVSANMAPITATRSLASPMLEAAILGAPSFDLWIAPAATARAIAALLNVRDLQQGRVQGTRRERLEALFAQQLHGGVHAQPYALEGMIRVAAIRGIAQRPKLAFELLR